MHNVTHINIGLGYTEIAKGECCNAVTNIMQYYLTKCFKMPNICSKSQYAENEAGWCCSPHNKQMSINLMTKSLNMYMFFVQLLSLSELSSGRVGMC